MIRSALLTIFLIAPVFVPMSAIADTCSGEGGVIGGEFDIAIECNQPGGGNPGEPTSSASSGPDPYVKYQWASVCVRNPDMPPPDLECQAALACAEPQGRLWQLWGQLPNGSWRVLGSQCFGGTPPAYEPPEVTPAMVLTALRRVGLPELTTHIQPSDKTLVNFDTIFWTDPQPVNLDLTILGQAVEVEARATRYRWVFGDGASATTESPGAPYPSKEITYRYLDADVTVEPYVEAVYSARFRVGGGEWQDIGETVTIVGPPSELRIVEGTPLLSDSR